MISSQAVECKQNYNGKNCCLFATISISAPFRLLFWIYIFTAKYRTIFGQKYRRYILKPIDRDDRLDRLSDGLTDHWGNINALGLIQILLEANAMIQTTKKAPELEGENVVALIQ